MCVAYTQIKTERERKNQGPEGEMPCLESHSKSVTEQGLELGRPLRSIFLSVSLCCFAQRRGKLPGSPASLSPPCHPHKGASTKSTVHPPITVILQMQEFHFWKSPQGITQTKPEQIHVLSSPGCLMGQKPHCSETLSQTESSSHDD